VRDFYGKVFIGHWPQDTAVQRVSRTVGGGQVVDALVMSFTHDVPIGALLPGVAPAGRFVRLPVCVVAGPSGVGPVGPRLRASGQCSGRSPRLHGRREASCGGIM